MANVNFKVYKRITNGLVDYLVLPGTNTPYGMSEANPSEANAWFQSHPQQLQAVKSDMPQYGGTAQQVDQLLQGSQVASGWSQRVDPITGQTNWGQWDVVDAKQRAYDAEIAAGTMERVPIGGGQFGYKKTAAGLAQLQSQLGQTGNISTPPTGGAASAGGTTPQNGSGQFGPSSYTGVSLRDYLASKGQPTGFSAQRILAQRFGIPNYTGTAQQNTELLAKLRAEGATPTTGTPGTTPPPTTAPGGTGAPTTGVPAPGTTTPPLPTGAAPTGAQGAQQYQNLLSMTANLQSGGQGTEVTQLQQFLQSQGFSPGLIDGKFGPKTAAALKQFQQSANIGVDGIVGPITRKAIQDKLAGTGGATDASASNIVSGTSATTDILDEMSPVELEYMNHLQNKSYDDYVQSFYDKLGLDSLQASITQSNIALQTAQDNKLRDIEDINNNPWISETLRSKKVTNTEAKHEAKLKFAQDAQTLAQKNFDKARQEAQFAAKMAVEQQNKDKIFAYKVYQDRLKAQGIDTQITSAGGRRLLIHKQTGAVIKDLGSSASTLNITGGGFSGTGDLGDTGTNNDPLADIDVSNWDTNDWSWYLDTLILSSYQE